MANWQNKHFIIANLQNICFKMYWTPFFLMVIMCMIGCAMDAVQAFLSKAYKAVELLI